MFVTGNTFLTHYPGRQNPTLTATLIRIKQAGNLRKGGKGDKRTTRPKKGGGGKGTFELSLGCLSSVSTTCNRSFAVTLLMEGIPDAFVDEKTTPALASHPGGRFAKIRHVIGWRRGQGSKGTGPGRQKNWGGSHSKRNCLKLWWGACKLLVFFF